MAMNLEFNLTSDVFLTSPLKWAGGKRWLAPVLNAVWRKYDGCRLVEPFVGGMSVAMALRPKTALLADINPHLVNFFRWLASEDGLAPKFAAQNEEVYYAARNEFNALISHPDGVGSKRAAELFYFLNRTCFNGICRFNASGGFNVPYGQRVNVPVDTNLLPYREALREWELKCCSFEALTPEPTDFVYADPPYDEGWTTYSAGGFSWDDQVRLAHWLVEHTGPTIASNHFTDRVVELYTSLGFEALMVMAPRRINSTGDRSPKAEALFVRGLDSEIVKAAVALLPTFAANPKAAASDDNQMDFGLFE